MFPSSQLKISCRRISETTPVHHSHRGNHQHQNQNPNSAEEGGGPGGSGNENEHICLYLHSVNHSETVSIPNSISKFNIQLSNFQLFKEKTKEESLMVKAVRKRKKVRLTFTNSENRIIR
jgi:hypothetical protein